jgi:23S rRNA-/tRNA-specific pseudouridylate synthase
MAAKLSKMFRSRKVEKRYLALVKGTFASEGNPLRIDQPIDGKQAVSEVTRLKVSADGGQSLLEVRRPSGCRRPAVWHRRGRRCRPAVAGIPVGVPMPGVG